MDTHPAELAVGPLPLLGKEAGISVSLGKALFWAQSRPLGRGAEREARRTLPCPLLCAPSLFPASSVVKTQPQLSRGSRLKWQNCEMEAECFSFDLY